MSKIGKEIDLTVQCEKSEKRGSQRFEAELLELAILEHFLKDNNREAAFSLQIEHELKNIF